jgi:hypothetical protein
MPTLFAGEVLAAGCCGVEAGGADWAKRGELKHKAMKAVIRCLTMN